MVDTFMAAQRRFVEAMEKADDRARVVAEALEDRSPDKVAEAVDKKLDTGEAVTEEEWNLAYKARSAARLSLSRKVEEVEAQLAAKDSMIVQLQQENEDYGSLAESSNRRSGELAEHWEGERQELEQQVADSRNRCVELADRLAEMEQHCDGMTRELVVQREEVGRAMGLAKARETTVQEVEEKLRNYQERAQGIFNEKDDQIQDLRASLAEVDSATRPLRVDLGTNGPLSTLQTERDDAVQRLESQSHELTAAMQECDAVRQELGKTRETHQAELQQVESKSRGLRDTIQQLQSTNRQLQSLYDAEVADHSEHRRKATEDMKEKDSNIAKLEKKLQQTKSESTDGDLETQLQSMAQHLMTKQTQLETVNDAKERLSVQLDAATKRLREMELVTRIIPPSPAGTPKTPTSDQSVAYDVEGGAVVVSQYRDTPLYQSLSRRGGLGSKVATTSAAIDVLSLKAGRVLRRSAVLRVGVTTYIIALHLWVFVVLSFSSPAHQVNIDTNSS